MATVTALIITLENDATSWVAARTCRQSIARHSDQTVDALYLPASTPKTMFQDFAADVGPVMGDLPIDKIIDKDNPNTLKYTYPKTPNENRLDLATGLYLKSYAAVDYNKIVATTVSHMRAWAYAIKNNQDVLVLEHDALFVDKLRWNHIQRNLPDYGIMSINSPAGATRRAGTYGDYLIKKLSDQAGVPWGMPVPDVNAPGEQPLPQGLPGNSAYLIQPWAAKELLKKSAEIGIWPNDALMCKEFFPWLKCYYYATKVQGTRSTTTT